MNERGRWPQDCSQDVSPIQDQVGDRWKCGLIGGGARVFQNEGARPRGDTDKMA